MKQFHVPLSSSVSFYNIATLFALRLSTRTPLHRHQHTHTHTQSPHSSSNRFVCRLFGVVRQIATKCNYLTASTMPQQRGWGGVVGLRGGVAIFWRAVGRSGARAFGQPGKLRNFQCKHKHKAKKLQVTQQSFGPAGENQMGAHLG